MHIYCHIGFFSVMCFLLKNYSSKVMVMLVVLVAMLVVLVSLVVVKNIMEVKLIIMFFLQSHNNCYFSMENIVLDSTILGKYGS